MKISILQNWTFLFDRHFILESLKSDIEFGMDLARGSGGRLSTDEKVWVNDSMVKMNGDGLKIIQEWLAHRNTPPPSK